MAVRRQQKRRSVIRPPMRSPGRAPVSRREHRHRFWSEIAQGVSSEDAGKIAGGSEKEAECPRFSSRRSRGATCRLPNARKLRSYTRKSLVSAPLPESLDELHPRSLVNDGEMLRPDPVVSITVRRRHSGTQTDVHDDRRLRSSPRTRRYVPGYRNASRAASVRRMVFR